MAELRLVGAKGDVTIPGPSPAELQIQQEQAAALQLQNKMAEQQAQEQQALAPYLYSQMGLTRTVDPTTGAVSFTKMTPEQVTANMTPDQQMAQQVQTAANARELSALQGNLQVDPSVESDLQRSKEQLTTQLTKQLGPGAEGSDAWNRAQAEFDRQANALRYSVRYGEMTSADAIASNRANELMAKQNQVLSNVKSATDPYASSAASLAGVVGSSATALAPMQQERFSAADIAMKNSSMRNAFTGNIIGGTLSAIGSGTGAYMACWIAEVLYGQDDPRTHLLRDWLNNVWAKQSPKAQKIMEQYRRHGREVAAWLLEHPEAQPALRTQFDSFLEQAGVDLQEA